MKSEELRYNNYFLYNGLIVQISGFRTYSTTKPLVRFEMMGGEYDIKSLIPIRLTEGILLKCGFLESLRVTGFTKHGIDLIPVGDGTFYENRNGIKIKYVHQLQNLVFVLANKELAIKL